MPIPARLWQALDAGTVKCLLCAHFCSIAPGAKGLCGVRENRQGTLVSLSYDKVAALHLDPIEKKPLFHFLVGTQTLSLGTPGCNLCCKFCQNWELSTTPGTQGKLYGQDIAPQKIVDMAKAAQASSIAYTYSEPTIFFELMYDTAKIARDNDLANIMVSNGFQSQKCLQELQPLIQAANIDLKAFTNHFYEDVCGARLKPVLNNLVWIKKAGWHLEVTTLVIAGFNDSDAELTQMARFIVHELGADTPWHVSRFHPSHAMSDCRPTPVETLKRAQDIGKAQGLYYVFVGNVPGSGLENTICPGCGDVLIHREGFRVMSNSLEKGRCPKCDVLIVKE